MSKLTFMSMAILGLCLSGCTMNDTGAHFTGLNAGDPPSPGSYCYENPVICVVGGVAVVGLAAGIIANSNQHSNPHTVVIISDSRLKSDVHPLMKLDNGIQLYTYHYAGDKRLFSGVLAQDLLHSAKFSHAVTLGQDGYYRVDYGMLGLQTFNGQVMQQAGEKAAARL